MNEAHARVLESVYVHEDRRLGRFLDRAGPDTVAIVVSDHGFQFRPYGFYHYGLDAGGGTLAPPGVIFLWGPPIRAGARLNAPTVFDGTPTVLQLGQEECVPRHLDLSGLIVYVLTLTRHRQPSCAATRIDA